jgi:hypothetical protein
MDTAFSLIPLSGPLPAKLYLMLGQHAVTDKMLQLIATLGLKGRLTILDCGNRSNMYAVAKLIRPYTNDPVGVLDHIRLSRAFTCVQVLAMLESVTANAPREPLIVLDLLATFLDEDVALNDAQKLLTRSIACLHQLSQTAPVVISGRPLPLIASARQVLLDQLAENVDRVWEEPVALPAGSGLQLTLFG